MHRNPRLRLLLLLPALAAILVLTFAIAPTALADGPPDPVIPDGLKGFAGELRGTVVEIYDHCFTVNVTEIIREWEHSTASNAAAVVGRTILINLRYEQINGHWRPVPRQLAWLRTLDEEMSVRLDLNNDEGERMRLMELNEEQRRAAEHGEHDDDGDRHDGDGDRHDGDGDRHEGDGDRHDGDGDRHDGDGDRHDGDGDRHDGDGDAHHGDADERSDEDLPDAEIPDDLTGFSGTLRGEVVQVGVHGFVLRVTRVVNTWRGNEAEDAESAVGKRLLINVRYEETDSGHWRPVPLHVRFVASLEVEDEINIEVNNEEGERLHILELSRDQRRQADEN